MRWTFGGSEWTFGSTSWAFGEVAVFGDATAGSWAFAGQAATGSTVAPLVLADSDDTGLEVDCKALLVASAPGTVPTGNVFFYANADRGGTDEPLDGELGLGADESIISGFRRRTATLLQLTDHDDPTTFDIGAYFNTGGDGNNLTVYLQTANDGEVSFPVAGNVPFIRPNQIRFTLPADAQTLLDNLASGDRWIFKLARPPAPETQELSMSATAGSPTATFALAAVAPPAALALAFAAVAGDPTASFNLDAVAAPIVGRVFDLGANPFASNADWEGSYLIDSSLVVGGATAYLRRIGESGGGNCRIDISSAASGSYAGAGPELIPAWENLVNAIVFSADGGGITLKGPNHPDNSFRDPTEPYFWTPDNSTAYRDWIAAEPQNVIARFNGPIVLALSFSAEAGDPTAAFNLRAVATATQALSMAASAGDPTATFALSAVAPPATQALSVSAEAGAPTAAFNLRSIASGAPQALSMSATAGDPTATFDLRTVAPAAADQLSVAAAAGAPTAAFNLRVVAPLVAEALSFEAEAGDPTASFALTAVAPSTALALSVAAAAGDPTATFNLRTVAPPAALALAFEAEAGNPAATFNLRAVAPSAEALSFAATAGNPRARFRLRRISPPATQALAFAAVAGDPTATFDLDKVDDRLPLFLRSARVLALYQSSTRINKAYWEDKLLYEP